MKGKFWLILAIINFSVVIIFHGILQQPLSIGSCWSMFLAGWCAGWFLVKNRPSALSLNSGKPMESKQ